MSEHRGVEYHVADTPHGWEYRIVVAAGFVHYGPDLRRSRASAEAAAKRRIDAAVDQRVREVIER